MVAHAPFSGETTRPTEVKVNRKTDKDGNTTEKSVEFPNDPHIATNLDTAGQRPQTLHSGYSQGGTTNPPAGDDGSVKFYAPKDRKGAGAGNIGSEEKSAEPQQKRDKEVNPRPHEAGPRFTDNAAGSGESKGTSK